METPDTELIAKPEKPKKPPIPLTEKEWNIYHDDLTTAVMVALSPTLVAVGRAHYADGDQHNKKLGREIARGRLRKYLARYRQDPTFTRKVTEYSEGKKPGHVVFEVVQPTELYDEEESLFNEIILKRFATPEVPEVLLARPEADGEGPIV